MPRLLLPRQLLSRLLLSKIDIKGLRVDRGKKEHGQRRNLRLTFIKSDWRKGPTIHLLWSQTWTSQLSSWLQAGNLYMNSIFHFWGIANLPTGGYRLLGCDTACPIWRSPFLGFYPADIWGARDPRRFRTLSMIRRRHRQSQKQTQRQTQKNRKKYKR